MLFLRVFILATLMAASMASLPEFQKKKLDNSPLPAGSSIGTRFLTSFT
jgi:hypothetical protein